MKILINSYWCAPGLASEPGVAWEYIERLSKTHKIGLITGTEYKSILENTKIPNLKIYFIKNKFHLMISKLIPYRNITVVLSGIYHYYWQLKAFLFVLFSKKIKNEKYEIFHHLSSFSWRWPPVICLLYKNSIWGPAGGGQDIPRAFLKDFNFYFRRTRRILQFLSGYDFINNICMHKLKIILCANTDTFLKIKKKHHNKCRILLETALDSTAQYSCRELNDRNNLVYAGSLIPLKGVKYAISAMQTVSKYKPDCILHIIGDGREMQNLKMQARDLNLDHNIIFHGRINSAEIKQFYKTADLFIMPSLQETSGNATLEALSWGVPVIGFNNGGTRDIIQDSYNGYLVQVNDMAEAVAAMASAIIRILKNNTLYKTLSQNAIQTIKDKYLWSDKIKILEHIYSSMI